MKCAVTQFFPKQIPYAHLALGTAFLTVPCSIGKIINRLLISRDLKTEVKDRGAEIIDLTEIGQRILEELRRRIDLDKKIFIAGYKRLEGQKEIKKIIASGLSSQACICMDEIEIDKTFNPQNADHFSHKLKLLLQLIQIKQRRQFGKSEQIYCLIATVSIAATSFSNLRLSWLWGLGVGQWAGNYWASFCNRQQWQRAQYLACQKVSESELPLCIDSELKHICPKDIVYKPLFLTPFDCWEDRGFSKWHLRQLITRAEQQQIDEVSSDEELLLDFDTDGDRASSRSSVASQFSFEEIDAIDSER